MMSNKPEYLDLAKQDELTTYLRFANLSAPSHETIFIDRGGSFAAGALLVSGFVFWRSSYRAFNLVKFGRRRLVTAFTPIFCCIQGSLAHVSLVKYPLYDVFRYENGWNFGLRSLLAHQIGLIYTYFIVSGFTFINAHDMGVIASPKRLFKKGYREEALKFVVSKLRPYAKHTAIAWAASSAFMFMIGVLEYKQTRHLLAKKNRTTLGLVEH